MKKLALTLSATVAMLVAAPSLALAFTPSTLFKLDATAVVEFVPASKEFKYTFQFKNDASSQQDIDQFGVSHGSPISDIRSPAGWTSSENFLGEPVVMWMIESFDEIQVRPGASQDGFSFSSKGVPTIQTWYAQSDYVYLVPESEGPEIRQGAQTNFWNNCKMGGTVAPGTPASASPLDTLEQLIALQDRAFNANWYTDRGIHNSLMSKLQNAQGQLQRGKANPAGNQIKAYLNELSAKRGKKLGNTTFGLLNALASYLHTQLN